MSCGANSGISWADRLAGAEQFESGEHLVEALVRRSAKVLFGQAQVVEIHRDEVDVQVEPARPHELDDPPPGRVHVTGLDPGHGRLADTGAGGQLPLRQAGSPSCLPYELPTAHDPSIHRG
jgi:hypothetical protein